MKDSISAADACNWCMDANGEFLGSVQCPNIRNSFDVDDLGFSHRDSKHTFLTCGKCGLVFRSQRPSAEAIIAETSQDVEKADGTIYNETINSAGYANYLADRVDRAFSAVGLDQKAGLRVLDVGCGGGFLMSELEGRHPTWTMMGVDPSASNCSVGSTRSHPIVQGTVDDLDRSLRFDAIMIYGNLQLHPNPLRTLQICRTLLSDEGFIVFETKNPESSVRRISRGAARLRLNSLGSVGRFNDRAWHGLIYGLPKGYLRVACSRLGLDVVQMSSFEPRSLGVDTLASEKRNVAYRAWQFLDQADRVNDNRAWLETTVRKTTS